MELWSSHFDLNNLSLSGWPFVTFLGPLYNILPLFPLEVSPVYLPQPEHRPRRYSTETKILSSVNFCNSMFTEDKKKKTMKRCDEKQTCEYCKFILHKLIKHIGKQNIISAWVASFCLKKERKNEMKKERNKERDKGGVCYHLTHISKMDRQEWLFIWKKERK